jgi:hypothetical protein
MLTIQLAQIAKLFRSKNGFGKQEICHLGDLSARHKKLCITIVICLLTGSITFVALQ